ncbi:hypothetical protein LK996_15935 [Lysobacter sp. A6]|uniref:DNA-binding protein n=1 Tax=Noviluteimonas lactosilytica TaxID=2888523 RepID=A0ABS8JLS0_9GAMM|nr:hypothetical protein [Lysobacter lactosilyticus]MCC8364562.1 hypothetical protein [Lysobacter lactosilyticus]
MSEYDFTLRFALPRNSDDAADCLDRLRAGGCDDATIGVAKKGCIALKFLRIASTPEEAVLGALAAVFKAIPGARLVEAETAARRFA